MPSSLRCAVYIRVSTEEQNLNGLSLPAQRRALTEYALQNGYTIVDYYADEGVSARKSMKNRKELMRLLEDVKQDKIDMILVTKLDRWFRNIRDYNVTEEILKRHGCHWKTIFENYDSSTANGQMIINIMLSVNQAECDRTSERIKAVFDYKRSIGEITSGRCACYGYRAKNGRLVKDENVSPIVEDAYACYFTCYSIRRVIAFLREKYGDKAPSPYIVDRFFKNETYAGLHGDNTHYCEPYITPEEFALIRQVTRAKAGKAGSETYLFSSLIKCPVCGCHLTGCRRIYHQKSGGRSVYLRYRCSNKYDRHPSPVLSESRIEAFLISRLFEPLRGETVTLKAPARGPRAGNAPSRLQNELERLNLLFQKGRIDEAYYEKQYQILENRLKTFPSHSSPVGETSGSGRAFRGSLSDLYESLDQPHKQAFFKSLIREIDIDALTHRITGFSFLS